MSERTFYFEEIPHSGYGKRTLHKVTIPELSESGGYTSVGALNAFNSGKRKTASKEDLQHHRANCNWGPKTFFQCKQDYEMDMAFEGTARAVATIDQLRKEKFPDEPRKPNIIEEQYGGDYQSWREIPTVDHDGIKAFFAHIGFDQKARGYVDPDGKAIKYSTVKPKPKEKTGPGMEM